MTLSIQELKKKRDKLLAKDKIDKEKAVLEAEIAELEQKAKKPSLIDKLLGRHLTDEQRKEMQKKEKEFAKRMEKAFGK